MQWSVIRNKWRCLIVIDGYFLMDLILLYRPLKLNSNVEMMRLCLMACRMTFDDFVTYFTEVSVCHLLNTSLFTFSRRWTGTSVYGRWTTGPRGSSADRAGGCANDVASFLRNPQYCFTLPSDDEEFIVQLSQPDVREKRAEGAKNMTIGLHILKVYDASLYLFLSISFSPFCCYYYFLFLIFFNSKQKK